MKKILSLCWVALLSVFFFGCSTTIPVQMTVPAEMNYNGARVIGVLPFSTSTADASQTSKDLLSYFSWYQNRELNDDLKLASYLSGKVENILASSDYFTVISSQELQEQAASNSISSDAIITGKIIAILEDSSDEYKTEKDENDAEIQVKYW